jgi:hypothetical protein
MWVGVIIGVVLVGAVLLYFLRLKWHDDNDFSK